MRSADVARRVQDNGLSAILIVLACERSRSILAGVVVGRATSRSGAGTSRSVRPRRRQTRRRRNGRVWS